MAIVKATYTKSRESAKASIRYYEHRPGKDGDKMSRDLFDIDGLLTRNQAYQLIDNAEKGSVFFRFVISPDPANEDTELDLHLPDITIKTMQTLEDILKREVAWVATEHNDHRPHRHVHVLAALKGKLATRDFAALRQSATGASLFQRQERDLARQAIQKQAQIQEEAQWNI